MNKYEIIGIIGEGAYGIVYKAKNKETQQFVAVKKFKQTQQDDLAKKTTLRQVKVLRMLKHDNIVQLKEAFKRKGRLYLVFELVEKNMLEILQQDCPNGLESNEVRKYIYQLIKSIDYCHKHDIIHRDIKPENLLVNTEETTMKLCDFGFARQLPVRGGAALTDYVATRWYRAPQLLLGDPNYGKQVDYWAIGCIMGELTDGQPIFPGETQIDQLFLIQKLIGPLTPEQKELMDKNPRFLGLKFPSSKVSESLNKNYSGKMSPEALDLMKSLLQMDPKDRITGMDAINHPYFDSVREANYYQGSGLSSVGSGSNVNRSIQSSHGFRMDPSAASSAGVGGKGSKAAGGNKIIGSSNNLAAQTQANKKLQSNPLSRLVLPQQTSSVLSQIKSKKSTGQGLDRRTDKGSTSQQVYANQGGTSKMSNLVSQTNILTDSAQQKQQASSSTVAMSSGYQTFTSLGAHTTNKAQNNSNVQSNNPNSTHKHKSYTNPTPNGSSGGANDATNNSAISAGTATTSNQYQLSQMHNPLIHNPNYSTFYTASNEYNYSINYDPSSSSGIPSLVGVNSLSKAQIPTKSTAVLNAMSIKGNNQNIILQDDDEQQKSGIQTGQNTPPPIITQHSSNYHNMHGTHYSKQSDSNKDQQPITRASIKLDKGNVKITTKKLNKKTHLGMNSQNPNNNTNKIIHSGAGVQNTSIGTSNVKINNLFDRNSNNNSNISNNNPIAGLGHRFVQQTPDGFVNIMGHTGDTGGDYLDDVELGQIAGVSSQANIIVNSNNSNNVYSNARVADGRNSPRGQASQQEMYFGVGATSQAGLKTLTGGGAGAVKKRKQQQQQQQDDYILPLEQSRQGSRIIFGKPMVSKNLGQGFSEENEYDYTIPSKGTQPSQAYGQSSTTTNSNIPAQNSSNDASPIPPPPSSGQHYNSFKNLGGFITNTGNNSNNKPLVQNTVPSQQATNQQQQQFELYQSATQLPMIPGNNMGLMINKRGLNAISNQPANNVVDIRVQSPGPSAQGNGVGSLNEYPYNDEYSQGQQQWSNYRRGKQF